MDYNTNLPVTDGHTLMIYCRSEEELSECVKQWTSLYPNHPYAFSLGRNRESNYQGFAYLRVNNELYNMLLGKNEDGTLRIQYVECDDDICMPVDLYAKTDWACDDSTKCVALPPLIAIPDTIKISPARIYSDEIVNVLVSKRVPNTFPIKKMEQYLRNLSNYANYPLVRYNDKFFQFELTFKPGTHDANFALFMLKNYIIDGNHICFFTKKPSNHYHNNNNHHNKRRNNYDD